MLFKKKELGLEMNRAQLRTSDGVLEKRTLSLRLAVGLLTPFVVVALFLLLVSKKMAVVPQAATLQSPTAGKSQSSPLVEV